MNELVFFIHYWLIFWLSGHAVASLYGLRLYKQVLNKGKYYYFEISALMALISSSV